MLDRLGPDWFDTHPTERQHLNVALNQSLEDASLTSNFPAGLRSLALLSRIDPDLAETLKTQYFLRWGRHYRERHQYEPALQLYSTNLMRLIPEIATSFVEQTLEEAERHFRTLHNEPAAIKLYESYGLPIAPQLARRQLVRIWRDLGWRDLRDKEYSQARAAFQKAESFQPGACKFDLLRLDFYQRREAIPDDDPLAIYELGVWSSDHMLFDEALELFRLVINDLIVGNNARAYVDKIRNVQAEQELLHMLDLFDAAQYKEVLALLVAFEEKGYPPGFRNQAQQLRKKTMDAMQINLAERAQQAEVLLQQAKRSYYAGDYEGAADKLQTIFDHYPSSVTYASARNFYSQVREKLELQRIEQGQSGSMPSRVIDTPTSRPIDAPSGLGHELESLYNEIERIHTP